MSICPRCGTETDSQRAYKLCANCIHARYRSWVEKNKDKIANYHHEYQLANKEKLKEYRKKRYQNGKNNNTI